MRCVHGGSITDTGDAQAKALACLAAGVAVVSVRGAGGLPEYVKAFSFNSVSLDPPLVAWSASAQALDALGIERGAGCGVSVLTDAQAAACAAPLAKGREMHWECGDTLGVPLVAAAAATFEVVITRRVALGRNDLCFAEVARFDYQPGIVGALRFTGEPVDFVPLG